MFKFILFMLSFLGSANVFAHGISEEAKQAMISGGYFQYIWLGAEHMITGYDHLLFLFGVIFFLKSFKDIVKFISVFTLGHSITLIFATFLGITANYWLVDAVIAISVCYKGFDNNKGFQNYFGMKKAPNLLLMVFVFGLIHGFGLSTRLQQLPLGEKGAGMLMRIVSFNVGVEVGQIAALAIMLAVLSTFRKSQFFKRFSKVANDGLILAGFMLLLMQL
ncbi:MAG: HupE/UreJ family protein, partial [Bacteriovoracaceae bacterium]|nr:HupE/UreJ family protein [Bacteriovoracaceae bacterium]